MAAFRPLQEERSILERSAAGGVLVSRCRMSEETAGRPQLREGAALQPGSAAGGEISFPFFQFSKTRNEEREHNEIQEMEFFSSFGQLKG